jgi:hypothetical protein
MKNEKQPDFDLNELLKQTLKDDLPALTEVRLKQQLTRFRRRVEERRRDEFRHSFGSRRIPAVFARTALAAAGILLVVLGVSIRGSGRQNILVSSFTAYQKEAAVFAGISDARNLKCRVRLSGRAMPAREFLIDWMSPRETRVRILEPDGEITKTVYLPAAKRSVLEEIASASHGAGGRGEVLDAQLGPIEDLLSSSRLTGLLEGYWQLESSGRRGDCDWESFSVVVGRTAPRSRIILDTCTGLPTRLEHVTALGENLEAVFNWNTENSGPLNPVGFSGPDGMPKASNYKI